MTISLLRTRSPVSFAWTPAALARPRPARVSASALALALLASPGLAGAGGLWDRVKEGASATYERGADLAKDGAAKGGDWVREGADKGGELIRQGAQASGGAVEAGLAAGGALAGPVLEYGRVLTQDSVDHFYRPGTPQEIRMRVDRMAGESLSRLFASDPQARALFDRSYGYAVFEVRQASLGLTAGYGYGVAVANGASGPGQRVYMKMLTGGLELSKGTEGLASEWVVLLEDEPSFRDFVELGLDATAQAGARAGDLKKGVTKRLSKGLSLYRVDKGGLKVAASLTGTRFWPDSALNPPVGPAPVTELPIEAPASEVPAAAAAQPAPAPAPGQDAAGASAEGAPGAASAEGASGPATGARARGREAPIPPEAAAPDSARP